MLDRHLFSQIFLRDISFISTHELLGFLCTVTGKDILRHPDEFLDWMQEYCPDEKVEAEIISRILRNETMVNNFLSRIDSTAILYERALAIRDLTDIVYNEYYYDKEKIYECVGILFDAIILSDRTDDALLKLYDNSIFYKGYKGLCLLEYVATARYNVQASGLFARELAKYRFYFSGANANELCMEQAKRTFRTGVYDYLTPELLEVFDINTAKEIISQATANNSTLNKYALLPYKHYDHEYALQAISDKYFDILNINYFNYYCSEAEAKELLAAAKKNGAIFNIHEILPEKYYDYELANDALLNGYVKK